MSKNVLNVESDKTKHSCRSPYTKWNRVENRGEQVTSKSCNYVEEYHVAKAYAIFNPYPHV